MPKLITPVSYSDKLAVCEQIGQPDMSDEIRQVIDLPLADLQPADNKPPAVGKFLRASQQGALLKHLSEQGFTSVEYTGLINKTGSDTWLFQFAQLVSFVIVRWTTIIDFGQSYWATPSGGIIKDFVYGVYTVCNFRGTDFYYAHRNDTGGTLLYQIYGFYR